MADARTICSITTDERFVILPHNENFLGEQAAFDLDDGASHYSGSFHGTPAPQSSRLQVLCITTAHKPKNPEAGFVFGKNAAVCDILLDDPTISDRQFSLPLNFGSNTLLLKNLSRHGTQVKLHKLNENILLKATRWLDEYELAQLSLGDNIKLEIERYGEPNDWSDFCDNLGTGLGLGQLRLSTNIETTNASKRAAVFIRERRLGSGANAQVFMAVEKHTGDAFAMKLYDKEAGGRWQEPEILERLRHQHIVRFVRYTKPAQQPAELIMELISGTTLQSVLDLTAGNRQLDPFEAREVLHQVLDAVAYVHSHDIMHRDLKPANIMVQRRDPIHVKLVDFGEAKRGKQFSRICGTPLYMAPEISKKRFPCTDKVDVFSLGVIALQLFYGLPTHPGEGETWSDAILRKRATLVAAAADDPSVLTNSFVCGLLREQPHRRPSARVSLGHDFFRSDMGLAAVSLASGDAVDWPTQLYYPTVSHPDPQNYDVGEPSSDGAKAVRDQASSKLPSTESWGSRSQYGVQLPEEQVEEEEDTWQQTSDSSTSNSHPSRRFTRSDAPTRSIPQANVVTSPWNLPSAAAEGTGDSVVATSTGTKSPDGSQVSGNPVSHPASQLQDVDSQSEAGYYYDGCWLDPLHDLGGGSFAENQRSSRRHQDTASIAGKSSTASEPLSEPTPILQNLLELEDGDNTASRRTSNPDHHHRQGGTEDHGSLAQEAIGHAYGTPEDHYFLAGFAIGSLASVPRASVHAGEGLFAAVDDEGPQVRKDGGEEEGSESDGSESARNQGNQPESRPIRRRRRTSAQNKAILETSYRQNPRPDNVEYLRLVATVSMSKKQIQVICT
ncbi:Protein kinase-like domain protein [Niveomyces insectorum RCEF 264]|uniref:Protein kinase-like domain protein n=1 Tax=Niveomyces insectorum RCEF 264 TaxID=1081102 RepID=A0A167SLT2_9HYPO|nr:Protein kinase-like domain protein [Niveomyces insectorum RCEF 264]